MGLAPRETWKKSEANPVYLSWKPTQKKVKDGFATQADLERLRYDKVSVEIKLFNAKTAHDHQESAVQPRPK